VRRITDVCALPLLVDVDTGFRRERLQHRAHGEVADQVGRRRHAHRGTRWAPKRCGHRPGKELVSQDEMVDRIKAAADAKTDPDFVVMARTDALAVEGLERAIDARPRLRRGRCRRDLSRGDDRSLDVPEIRGRRRRAVLANLTEFGRDAAVHCGGAAPAKVAIALYPLSAFRAMNAAALKVYNAIRREGTQKNVVDAMQTRADLYDVLDYHAYERKLDELFAKDKGK